MSEKQNPPEVQGQQFKGPDLVIPEHGATLAMPKLWDKAQGRTVWQG